MCIDDKVRNFSRRQVLSALGLAALGAACHGKSPSGPTPVPTPTPTPLPRDVTRSYEVQDTDGKVFGSFSAVHKEGKGVITPDFLSQNGISLNGVDPDYFTINEDYSDGLFGRQVAQARAGSAPVFYSADGHSIITFLKIGIDWAGAFATGGAGYGPGFGNGIPAQGMTVRQMLPGETVFQGTSYEMTIVDGAEQPLVTAVRYLNNLMAVGSHRIANLGWTGKNAGPSILGMGYYPSVFGNNGYHGKDFAVVNEFFGSKPIYYDSAIAYGFVELCEVVGGFDDLYGKDSVYTLTYLGDPSDKAPHIMRAAALFGLPRA